MSYEMFLFLGRLVFSIIVQSIAIIFGIKAVKTIKKNNGRYKNKDKYNRFIAIVALCSSIGALIVILNFEVPEPEIYVSKTNSLNYTDDLEIEIISIPFFDTYYTIDESNPKNGKKYTDSFIISKPTKILAQNNFFVWWSDVSEKEFGYQKLSYKNESEKAYKSTENESSIKNASDKKETELNESNTNFTNPIEQTHLKVGINTIEGYELMVYINQYRKESGISELTWNSDLEQTAKYTATSFAEGVAPISDSTCLLVGRQCNSATNAQEAVSDWIEGNKYILSESNGLLDDKYTQIGGALYYLPNGSESGYHYFWIVCLK